MKYNGWENYETWLVNTWIDEDYGLKEGLDELLEDKDLDDYDAAKKLQSFVEGMNPLDTCGLWYDLVQSALDTVNWKEIIENCRRE